MTVETWGWHFSTDAWYCNVAKICSAQNIEKFATELVKRIDMKAFGPPQVDWFGEGNKEGYTLHQPIETSNITAHFTHYPHGKEPDGPDGGAMFLDVFSCKPYDPNIVINTIHDFFGDKVSCHNIRFVQRKVMPPTKG